MPVPAAIRPLADLIREDGIPEATARRWTKVGGLGLTHKHGVEVVGVDEWRRFVKNHRQTEREKLMSAGDPRMANVKLVAFDGDLAEVHAVAGSLGVRARFVEPYVVRLGLQALKQRVKNGESLDALAAEVNA